MTEQAAFSVHTVNTHPRDRKRKRQGKLTLWFEIQGHSHRSSSGGGRSAGGYWISLKGLGRTEDCVFVCVCMDSKCLFVPPCVFACIIEETQRQREVIAECTLVKHGPGSVQIT